MRLPWQRLSGPEWLAQGADKYEVTLARCGTDIETVTVGADSPDEAMEKAQRYLFANIHTRRITFGGVTYRPTLDGAGNPTLEAADGEN